MTLQKRFLKSKRTHFLLSFIISLAMRAIYATCRVEVRWPEAAVPYGNGSKAGIFCFWHGRLVMHAFVKPPGRPMSVLISNHSDGTLVTHTMKWFNIGSVRGSRNMGGSKALRALFQVTERGGNICITPDGPRGPFQKAVRGAAFVAAKTNYPIISIAFSASRHWRLKTWDKFMLPKPFSRIVFIASEPLFVTNEADDSIDLATHALQTALDDVTARSDEACGVPA